ncbi:MAG: RidA family protein [Nitrososphaerales archaeon]
MSAISTDDAPKAIGPYSQGVEWNRLLFLSGQIPLDPKSGSIEATTIEEQTTQVLRNLEAILKAAGSDLSKVLKCTVFLADLDEFASFNKIYGTYFSHVPPARSTVQVAKLPRGAKVEIDVIAFK